jgi:hypothetical protein
MYFMAARIDVLLVPIVSSEARANASVYAGRCAYHEAVGQKNNSEWPPTIRPSTFAAVEARAHLGRRKRKIRAGSFFKQTKKKQRSGPATVCSLVKLRLLFVPLPFAKMARKVLAAVEKTKTRVSAA